MFKTILVATLIFATISCILGAKESPAKESAVLGGGKGGNGTATATPGETDEEEGLNGNSTENAGGGETIRGRNFGSGLNGILAGGYGGLGAGGPYPGSALGGNGLGVYGGGLGPVGIGQTGPGGFPGDDGQYGGGRFGGLFPGIGGVGAQSNPDFLVEEVTFTCRAYGTPGVGQAPVIQWSVDTSRGQPYPIAIGPQIYGNQRGVNVDYRPEVPGIWVSRLTFSKPTIYGDPYNPSKTYVCSVVVPGRQPIIVGYASLTSSPTSVGGQAFYAGGLTGGSFGGGFGSPYDYRSAGGANAAAGAMNDITGGAGGVNAGR